MVARAGTKVLGALVVMRQRQRGDLLEVRLFSHCCLMSVGLQWVVSMVVLLLRRNAISCFPYGNGQKL